MFLQGFHLLMRGGPMMTPLLFCAVLSLAVIIERALYLRGITEGRSLPNMAAQMRRGLPVLDTIITVAPLLGLLGTVTGMIKAFGVLNRPGSGPLGITGGVAEALIATATGLGIAIVSLVGYNSLTARVRTLLPAAIGLGKAGQWKPKKARIEIIPMIDTIFFLLVFFMIESLSMVQLQAHKVSLPVSATAQARPDANVVVTLTGDGEYYLDRQPISESDIRPLVAARLSQSPSLTVVINCDKTQPIRRFARISGSGQAGQCRASSDRDRAGNGSQDAMKIPPQELRKARIEIIPMIDTIFFLLVFFMYTSLSMVKMNGMEVPLPRPNPNTVSPPTPEILVFVSARGQYLVDMQPVMPAQLRARLSQRVAATPNAIVVVHVTDTLPTQALITVLDALHPLSGPDGRPVPVLVATEKVPSGQEVGYVPH